MDKSWKSTRNSINLRKRKQLRLKDYDYAQEGAYFVTICTQDRKIHFEENSSLMNIVRTQWVELPEAFSNIYLDEFTIMLEHIHGIIFIERRGLIPACRQAGIKPLIGRRVR